MGKKRKPKTTKQNEAPTEPTEPDNLEDLPPVKTKISFTRKAIIKINMNPHYDNWKPRENLRKLKGLVHGIVKVKLTRIARQ